MQKNHIFYDRTSENITKLRQALLEFGFTEKDIAPELFLKEGNIITFGIEPLRVDLLNRIDGLSYAEAKMGKVAGQYGKVKIFFIGKKDLLKNKSSTSRPQDKMDVDSLN